MEALTGAQQAAIRAAAELRDRVDAEAAARLQVEEATAVLQKQEADLQTKRDELKTKTRFRPSAC